MQHCKLNVIRQIKIEIKKQEDINRWSNSRKTWKDKNILEYTPDYIKLIINVLIKLPGENSIWLKYNK